MIERPRRRCARSASACAACGTTTTSRASRLGRDELPRALEPDVSARHRPRAEGDRLPLRDHRPAGLPHRQPERRPAAAACVTDPLRAAGGAHRPRVPRRCTCRSCRPRSKISTRSTSRSACATSTSRSISRTRPATRSSSLSARCRARRRVVGGHGPEPGERRRRRAGGPGLSRRSLGRLSIGRAARLACDRRPAARGRPRRSSG